VTNVDINRFGREVDGAVIRQGIRIASTDHMRELGSSKWLTWRASD